MRLWRRIAAASAVAAAVSGAAGATADLSHIHTIAVVSRLKNDLQLQTMGATIFDKSANTEATDWDVNGAFQRRLVAALDGRFALRPITLPPGTFENLRVGLFESPRSVMRERIKALPKIEGVDAYLVVSPWWGLLRDETRGLFVYHDSGLISGKGTVVSVPYGIALYDANTGELLGDGRAEIPWSGTFSGYGEPSEACADDFWMGDSIALDDAQKTRIHQEVFSLLERSVPFALSNAGLISEDAAKAMLAAAPAAEPSCHGL